MQDEMIEANVVKLGKGALPQLSEEEMLKLMNDITEDTNRILEEEEDFDEHSLILPEAQGEEEFKPPFLRYPGKRPVTKTNYKNFLEEEDTYAEAKERGNYIDLCEEDSDEERVVVYERELKKLKTVESTVREYFDGQNRLIRRVTEEVYKY